MTHPAVETTGLAKHYGDVEAVRGIDLTVHRGEIFGVLGPNGAGKSTTIDMILGLQRPDRGTAAVFGRAPDKAVAAGLVGAMLQHGGLPSEARVGEVLHLVRRSYPDPWPLDDLVTTAGISIVATWRLTPRPLAEI